MRRRTAVRLATVAALVAGMFVGVGGQRPAFATSITVNTALDIAPNPATGHFPTDGKCSLRAAIQSAQFNSNANDVDCATGLGGGVLDTIHIDPSLAGQTMTLTYATVAGVQPFDNISGPDNPLEIIGPTTNAAAFVIDGGGKVRPFYAGFVSQSSARADLRLANLTVRGGNGHANGNGSGLVDGDGGAFYLGDGTHLTLDNVFIRDNTVGNSARGGAIYAVSPTITNNGGAYINNHASGNGSTGAGGGRGGAIFVESGPWTMNGYAMLLQGNGATFAGGAIATNPGSESSLVHFERSLIRDNTAPTGGVIYVDSSNSSKVFDLTDSTVFNNSSVLFTVASQQTFNYLRDTFVSTGAIFRGGGGFMANSIVTGSSCTNTGGGVGFTGSRNLITGCLLAGLNDIGDITGLAPALAQNGGPEVQQTFALQPPSNAMDNGNETYCGTIDARSVPRGTEGNGVLNSPQHGDCDIGAYEYAKFVVNFTTGTSSVNEAAGTVNIPVKLRLLDPDIQTLTSPLTVPIALNPASTASIGPDLNLDDLDVVGSGVTFPIGSKDGAIANLVVHIHQDDIAERFGENALIDLVAGGTPGVAIAEPREHELSIQDDDQAGVIVDDGGNGTTVSEAAPTTADTISVRLQSRPDRTQPDPKNPQSFGPPADVTMSVEPDRDCTVKFGATTGSQGHPLSVVILNADWKTPHVLQVLPVDDLFDEDLRDETVTHICEIRYTFTSGDPVYNATQDASEVTVKDNDVAGVTVVHTGGPVPLFEGSSDSDLYSIRLDTPPDPGKPLPNPPRGPTQVVATPTTGCDVGNGDGVAKAFSFDDTTWATPQVLAVRATDNLKVELAHSCTVKLTVNSPDPVYANLDDLPVWAKTPPTITEQIQDYDPPQVTDDPPFVIVDTGGSINVREDAASTPDTFTVRLQRAPVGANVSVALTAPVDPLIVGNQVLLATGAQAPTNVVALTFDANTWNVPQTVKLFAVNDDFDEPDTHTGTVAVTMSSTAPGFSSSTLRKVVVDGVATLNGGTIAASIADNDTSAVVVTASGGSTNIVEGGATDTIAVSLATHPYQDVHVTLTADAQCTVDGGPSKVIDIAAANWNAPTVVTVAAVDDPDVEASPHSCAITATAASADLLYAGLTTKTTAAVTDNDSPLVLVTTGAGVKVAEGSPATGSVSVVLGGRPDANVTVNLTTADGQTTVTPSLTFTHDNWNVAQQATIAAVDDNIDEADVHTGIVNLSVTTTATRFTPATIRVDGVAKSTFSVDITDNDTAAVAVSTTTISLTESGSPITYTVTLRTQPTAGVTLTPHASGLCTVSGPLSFDAANWNTPHTVTVTPGNDTIVHAQQCTVSHTVTSTDLKYDGIAVANVSGSVVDDDVARVTITAGSLALSEATPAATVSYSVVLDTQPIATVTVTATPDAQVTVSGGPLLFTSGNWNVPQVIVVHVVDDTVVEASPHRGAVTNAVTSGDPAYGAAPFRINGSVGSVVVLAITDNDTTTAIALAPAQPDTSQAVQATVTVAGGPSAPTGAVALVLDGAAPTSATLTAGVATASLGALGRGSHTLTATYPGDAAHSTSKASVTFSVAAIPVAGDDLLVVAEDAAATQVNVLANDTDADGDPLTVSGHGNAAHGTVSCTTTACTYTPAANYNGNDSFTYTVTDGAHTATGTVKVTVTPVNDPPTLGAVTVQATSGTAVTFDVLAGAADVDGDTLSVSGFTQPAHGVVTCTAAGKCTYTSTAGYSGPDEFQFTVTDGKVAAASVRAAADGPASVVGTAHITVTAAAATPTTTTTTPATGTPTTTTTTSPAAGTTTTTTPAAGAPAGGTPPTGSTLGAVATSAAGSTDASTAAGTAAGAVVAPLPRTGQDTRRMTLVGFSLMAFGLLVCVAAEWKRQHGLRRLGVSGRSDRR